MQSLSRPAIAWPDALRSFSASSHTCRRCAQSRRAALSRRHITTSHSVSDDDIARLAATPLHPLTLADLVRHGRPPLSPAALFASANFTRAILPPRLAHRIASLRSLPYIVVANPHVAQIHANYERSLATLLPWWGPNRRPIDSREDEARFTEALAELVRTHANTIAVLARGFLEARRYIAKGEVTRFLDEHLRARIGTRLVAEQHIALHFASSPSSSSSSNDTKHNSSSSHNDDASPATDSDSSYIGVIDTALHPAAMVRHCAATVGDLCELRYGVRPRLTLDGEPGYAFAHVPVHLDYIVTELLKNAFRATIERGREAEPVQVTIAPRPEEPALLLPHHHPLQPPPAATATSAAATMGPDAGHPPGIANAQQGDPAAKGAIRPLAPSTPGVTIRIRDRGGGIAPHVFPRIWGYSFTTVDDEDGTGDGYGHGNGGGGTDVLSQIAADSGVAAGGGGGGGGADGGGGAGAGSIAGLGYGLPLGRAYAEYFGGGIAVQSLWGWGTDVYLSLRGVGKVE